MPNSQRILVFIPAYRCAAQIVRVLDQLRSETVHHWFEEILVLDNRSPDATADAAMAAARDMEIGKVSVARNRHNYGLGGSHKVAFQYALEHGFSHVVVLHGDDQGCINDIIPVLQAGDHQRFDCCLGARFHPRAQTTGYSPVRVAGNHVFNWAFSLAARRRLHDLGSGLNLYRVQSLSSGYWTKFHDNLMFNYCMILAHSVRKDKMHFFPISWREEDQISNVKILSQSWRTLGILARFIAGRGQFIGHEFRSHPFSSYELDMLLSKA